MMNGDELGEVRAFLSEMKNSVTVPDQLEEVNERLKILDDIINPQ